MSHDSIADPPPARGPRTLLVAGSSIRLLYGVGALLAPAWMVSKEFAPDTHGQPDPRLTLRAFGGHQLITGCLTLIASKSRRSARIAATLSLLIDTFDVISAMLEVRARGQADASTVGGIAFSGAGMGTFALALRGLRSAA